MISVRRVAALYDIHGNLPALEAMLAEVARTEVDLIVVGGDVLPGPMPVETLRRLVELDVPVQFIYGNGEVAVLDEAAGREPRVPKSMRETIRWVANALESSDLNLLGKWPQTLRVNVANVGEVLFCHATPRNENEIFTRVTSPARVAEMFGDAQNAKVAVCGHTHIPFDRTVRGLRIVNAGSVGMSFGEPSADWLLLGPDTNFRRTNYDLESAADRVRRTDYPGAEQFASANILNPPSAETMEKMFENAGGAGS